MTNYEYDRLSYSIATFRRRREASFIILRATDTETIVWGGAFGFDPPNTGGRYDPVTNTWTAVAHTALQTSPAH